MLLPIAEIFDSIQGEGIWTGAPMRFIRLSGCNVGRYVRKGSVPSFRHEPSLANILGAEKRDLLGSGRHSICTTCDGQELVCDTDYHASEEVSVDQALSGVWQKHVCITGGEPFLHWGSGILPLLLGEIAERGAKSHIETSGTLDIRHARTDLWVTCSPKVGFLESNRRWIDEWKFLVGSGFNEQTIVETIGDSEASVFLQPINARADIYQPNVELCVDVLRRHPTWRLSAQLHKLVQMP
jgi:7-carboxy-7-deazaguanine synthase